MIGMAYPYDDNWNWNLGQNSDQHAGGSVTPPEQHNGWQNPAQPVQAPSDVASGQEQPTMPPVQTAYQQPVQQPATYWDGSSYRSAPQPHMPPQKEKKPRKGGRLALKIVAVAAACVMVSAGSVGAFVALVNNGVVQLNAAEGETSSQGSAAGSGTSLSPVTNPGDALTLQEIADKVIPTVVCIQNYQQAGGGYGQWGNGQQSVLQEAGEGSGIIATSDGYIITNAHVVDGADALKVVLSDGTIYEAELIGADEQTDLALIKVDATGLPAAEFGSSEDLQVADMVMAVGNPGGMAFQSSVTIGYVSALNRQVESSDGYTMTFIQTDAAINPGNSGGALVNVYGQVIGINSAKIEDTAFEGLGFAIPIDQARPIIDSLKEYGYVKDRAALGISGTYIDSLSARFYGLTEGMYVGEIHNTSLSAAGLQKGDVITAIDGTDVTSANTISTVVGNKKPGDTVTLEVYRSRSTFTITATLVESTGS